MRRKTVPVPDAASASTPGDPAASEAVLLAAMELHAESASASAGETAPEAGAADVTTNGGAPVAEGETDAAADQNAGGDPPVVDAAGPGCETDADWAVDTLRDDVAVSDAEPATDSAAATLHLEEPAIDSAPPTAELATDSAPPTAEPLSTAADCAPGVVAEQASPAEEPAPGVPEPASGSEEPAAEACGPADSATQAAADASRVGETVTVPEAETGFVPANRLVQSEKNARKTNKGRKIEGLAASILRQGLLQNLVVSRGPDDTFPVEAGERRRLAIALLVQGKHVPEDWPVPVRFVDAADRTAASTMENEQREGMHPADQFEAFRQLATDGWTIDEIADTFSVTPLIVERRLALATAAPALLELLRGDGITTEQLMALCTTDDHERQVSVWNNTPDYYRNPAYLRRTLVSAEIDLTTDTRVAFIGGVAAFVAAGGEVRRDLFSTDGQGGFTRDGVLLDRLVVERLEAAAAEVRAEGWGWVDIWPQWNHTEFYRLGRIERTVHPLSPDALARVEALQAENEGLLGESEAFGEGYADYDDMPDDDRERYDAVSARIDEISDELSAIQRPRVSFDAEAVPAAGAIVGIEHGKLRIERGLVRTADRPKVEEAVGGTQRVVGGRETEVAGRKSGQLSDPVTRSLYGHRNLAAQSATAANAHVAKVLLACWMVQTLRQRQSSVPIDLRISDTGGYGGGGTRTGHPIADESGETRRKAFDALGHALVAALPKAEDALWDALMAVEPEELDRIIAFAVASAVSLERKHAGLTAKLLTALGFDMADHFTPTADNYFSRVPKALIVEALGEAKRIGSDAQRSTLQALKKGDLAARAETEVRGTRWVPALIRTPKAKAPSASRKKRARKQPGAGAPAGAVDPPPPMDARPELTSDAPPAAAEPVQRQTPKRKEAPRTRAKATAKPGADAPTGVVDPPPIDAGPVAEAGAEIRPTTAPEPASDAPPAAAEPVERRTPKRKEAPRAKGKATAKRGGRKPDELATARKKKEGASPSPKSPAARRRSGRSGPGTEDAPRAPDAAPGSVEQLAA